MVQKKHEGLVRFDAKKGLFTQKTCLMHGDVNKKCLDEPRMLGLRVRRIWKLVISTLLIDSH
jgi:hypothetical protein